MAEAEASVGVAVSGPGLAEARGALGGMGFSTAFHRRLHYHGHSAAAAAWTMNPMWVGVIQVPVGRIRRASLLRSLRCCSVVR